MTQGRERVAGLGDLLHTSLGLVAEIREKNGLWAPGSHQQWGGGGGQGGACVSPLSLEVNVNDWRNKAGIYWEGADLSGGQGRTNLLLLLLRVCPTAGCPSSGPTTEVVRPWHPIPGHSFLPQDLPE